MTSDRGETARPGPPDLAGIDPAGDEALADAFGAVARQLRDRSAETLAPWDVTPAHLRALRTLARHGTMRLSELSDRLQIAPRTATEVVDALESRDLVRRRADPGDRRATLVEMTEHGADILAEIRATRGPEASRVFGPLTPAERAELARILSKLRDLARSPGHSDQLPAAVRFRLRTRWSGRRAIRCRCHLRPRRRTRPGESPRRPGR